MRKVRVKSTSEYLKIQIKLSFRIEKRGALGDFERGKVSWYEYCRNYWSTISCITVSRVYTQRHKKEKLSSEQQVSGQKKSC